MDERLQIFQDKMEKSLANLNEEFAGIRAGRANPHVLDKLRVDYYGTPSPIQSVANVSVPEPRMIQIQPWEASMVKEIEKAILSSDLGINPTNDGKLIRLVFPELTEERRKELAKANDTDGYTHFSNDQSVRAFSHGHHFPDGIFQFRHLPESVCHSQKTVMIQLQAV